MFGRDKTKQPKPKASRKAGNKKARRSKGKGKALASSDDATAQAATSPARPGTPGAAATRPARPSIAGRPRVKGTPVAPERAADAAALHFVAAPKPAAPTSGAATRAPAPAAAPAASEGPDISTPVTEAASDEVEVGPAESVGDDGGPDLDVSGDDDTADGPELQVVGAAQGAPAEGGNDDAAGSDGGNGTGSGDAAEKAGGDDEAAVAADESQATPVADAAAGDEAATAAAADEPGAPVPEVVPATIDPADRPGAPGDLDTLREEIRSLGKEGESGVRHFSELMSARYNPFLEQSEGHLWDGDDGPGGDLLRDRFGLPARPPAPPPPANPLQEVVRPHPEKPGDFVAEKRADTPPPAAPAPDSAPAAPAPPAEAESAPVTPPAAPAAPAHAPAAPAVAAPPGGPDTEPAAAVTAPQPAPERAAGPRPRAAPGYLPLDIEAAVDELLDVFDAADARRAAREAAESNSDVEADVEADVDVDDGSSIDAPDNEANKPAGDDDLTTMATEADTSGTAADASAGSSPETGTVARRHVADDAGADATAAATPPTAQATRPATPTQPSAAARAPFSRRPTPTRVAPPGAKAAPVPKATPAPARRPPPAHIGPREHMLALSWFEHMMKRVRPTHLFVVIDHYRDIGWLTADEHHWLDGLAAGIAERRDATTWKSTNLSAKVRLSVHRDAIQFLELLRNPRVGHPDVPHWHDEPAPPRSHDRRPSRRSGGA